MRRREMLMQMRTEGTLKGMKPAFIIMKKNTGGMYSGGTAHFIMSFKNNTLYFQNINIFNSLRPKKDFEIDATQFKSFELDNYDKYSVVRFYREDDKWFPIAFFNYDTEKFTCDNVDRILRQLEKENGLVYRSKDGK